MKLGNIIKQASTEIAGTKVELIVTDIKHLVKVSYLTFNLNMEAYSNIPKMLAQHIKHANENWTSEELAKAVEFLIAEFKK